MIVNRYVVHVLNKDSDVPILNEFEGKISHSIDKLIQAQVRKIFKSDLLRKAKFNNYSSNVIRNCCEAMIHDENTFLVNSKEIASYLFEIMKINANISNCDLLISLINHKDEKYIAILKLDYKNLYNHQINFENEKINIQMLENEIGISSSTMIKQAAIVGVNSLNDEYDLLVLCKESEVEGRDTKFISEFLDVRKVIDDSYKTKMFEALSKHWINGNVPDMKLAEDIRNIRNYMLKENSVMDINKFINTALRDTGLENDFREYAERNEFSEDFNINKKYIEKKLKRRTIKTDIGFEVKGNLEDFDDPMKFAIRVNDNNTCDLIIKNVMHFEDK